MPRSSHSDPNLYSDALSSQQYQYQHVNSYKQVKSFLTWYLDFKDVELRESFRHFLVMQKVGSPSIAMCGFVVAGVTIPILAAILAAELRTAPSSNFFGLRVLIAVLSWLDAILAFLAGWMLYRKRTMESRTAPDGSEREKLSHEREQRPHIRREPPSLASCVSSSCSAIVDACSLSLQRTFVRCFFFVSLLSSEEYKDLMHTPSLLRNVRSNRVRDHDRERLSLAEDFFSLDKELYFESNAPIDIEKGKEVNITESGKSRVISESERKAEMRVTNAHARFDFLVSMLYFHAMQFLVIFYYVRRAYSLNCYMEESSLTRIFGFGTCFSEAELGPQIGVAGMFMLSHCLFLCITIPETPIVVVWWLMGVSFAVSLPVIALQGIERIVPTWCLFAALNVFAIVDTQLNSVIIFLSNRRLCAALQEAERMKGANSTHEAMHWLGNIASELKKPLSLLSSSIDYANRCLSDYSSTIRHNFCNKEHLYAFLDAFQSALLATTSAKNAMQMTVHQCIDFMKANKGIRLTPRIESLNLGFSLSVPVTTVRALQRAVDVRLLLPVGDAELCSHIITDKLWLQENLLCLLSFAINFSKEGDCVETRLRLTSKSSLIRRQSSLRSQSYSEREKDRDRSSRVHPSAPSDDEDAPRPTGKDSMHLLVEVWDSRSSLSKEALQTVFSPTPSLSLSLSTDVVALGWFCLAKRVAALQGYCGVNRRRDRETDGRRESQQGSTFWFSIPYRPDHSVEDLLRADEQSDEDLFGEEVSMPMRTSYDAYDESGGTVGEREGEKVSSKSDIEGESEHVCDVTVQSVNSAELQMVKLHQHEKLGAAARNSSHDRFGENAKSKSSFVASLEKSLKKKSSSRLRVLVVDDSASVLQSTASLLRRTGRYSVITAECGNSAISQVESMLLRRQDFDVIAMDIQMPLMDGITAIRKIRALYADAQTTRGTSQCSSENSTDNSESSLKRRALIIALSAFSDEETMQEALFAGADEFLCKPFDENIFDESVRRMFGHSNLLL